ncbi:phage terminase large subunit family protein [Breoghania sp.]|uniref:phage terminase large subunit family protein n=1 Tax=Breoghania sp. TaxID=2065378 RepID=UPI002AA7AF40|nr:phage terminase large subunit family protein [Breoghania sp.]
MVNEATAGRERLRAAWREAYRPDPPYTVSEWADKNRMLSSVASPEPGRWRTDRTPYLREIMDNLSAYSTVEQTALIKGVQMGASEAGLNFVGYAIHHSPGPCMYVMPTVEMSKKLSKTRLDPMIEESPALSQRIKPARSRDSGNTIFSKEFDGGVLILTGANSGPGLRSQPVRYLVLDEVDAYPESAGSEGDPVNLAIERTSNFVRRKVFMLSTPLLEEKSRIQKAYEAGDKREYRVPCVACGVFQPITWKAIKWEPGEPDTARFVCSHCGHRHAEHEKDGLLALGEWVPTKKPDKPNFRSYHLPSLYSPWKTWADCARRFLAMKDDPAQLQTFVNTILGEPWSGLMGESADPDELFNRREEFPIDHLPDGVAALTCGVDVQPDRLELEVVGWGRDEESWSIDYQVIPGDPSGLDVWDNLDDYLSRRWAHPGTANGMRILATCVDTGGANTQSAYAFVRPREGRRIWGIKGMRGARPVWPRKPSRNNKGKINLYLLGVDAAKEVVTARFTKSGPGASGAGACHWPMERDKDYFEQLTAEKKVTRYQKGFRVIGWEKKDKARNEAFDCRVYAYAALQGLLAGGWSLNKAAAKIERETGGQAVLAVKNDAGSDDKTQILPSAVIKEASEPAAPVGKASRKIKRRRRVARSGFMG